MVEKQLFKRRKRWVESGRDRAGHERGTGFISLCGSYNPRLVAKLATDSKFRGRGRGRRLLYNMVRVGSQCLRHDKRRNNSEWWLQRHHSGKYPMSGTLDNLLRFSRSCPRWPIDNAALERNQRNSVQSKRRAFGGWVTAHRLAQNRAYNPNHNI